MNKPIFTITTLRDLSPTGSQRVVGFFYELDQCKKVVENNDLDIHENFYRYVVIEKVHEGIYSTDGERYFYEWIAGKYVSIDCPEEVACVINFGIG